MGKSLGIPRTPVFRERGRRPAAGGDNPAKPPSLNVPIRARLETGRVLRVGGTWDPGWQPREQRCGSGTKAHRLCDLGQLTFVLSEPLPHPHGREVT